MTLKNNRAPLLSNIKLCASFHHRMWIQTGVTVRKRLSWVLTSVTLTFDLWPWPFAWTSLLSLVITPENFMMIRWWEHSQKHTLDLLWEKFQWILPLYMKSISLQSKASVVCSVTATIFIDFCLKKLNEFSQHIGQKTNEYLNSTEQIPRNGNVNQFSVLTTSWDIT